MSQKIVVPQFLIHSRTITEWKSELGFFKTGIYVNNYTLNSNLCMYHVGMCVCL